MEVFEQIESEVRGYCRTWPTVFETARGCRIVDEHGRRYLDFFSGAGALNYGHNHPALKRALLEYLVRDGVVHALDMYTTAKRAFLDRFRETILGPRGLDYKVQFPGPTGTNAVEAALKLARKVTGREGIVSFTNAFHGMTLGSLSVTGNSMKRGGAGIPLVHGTSMPFDGYLGDDVDTIEYLESFLDDSGSGLDLPAAVIVETVQAEGGLNTASFEWLGRLANLCERNDILLIVDDIQAGCGRTGPFFSFEPAGLRPDIVCLSKSLSGYGLPMALTLLKPELDVWEPGEHNGTFRGNNPAFVTATEALRFWEDETLSRQVAEKAAVVTDALDVLALEHAHLGAETRGRGLLQGLRFESPELAAAISEAAFERGLLIETSGADGEVVKLLPPIVIEPDDLAEGLALLSESVAAVLGREPVVA
ncbi:MAG: diaminobutyrate--2-oxoglutarate transaminase [Acidimicrobiia bacterium]|nr:diaminobutyrate--2-oxoglutarate transaminase [Acidimicrobiia bacterium]